MKTGRRPAMAAVAPFAGLLALTGLYALAAVSRELHAFLTLTFIIGAPLALVIAAAYLLGSRNRIT